MKYAMWVIVLLLVGALSPHFIVEVSFNPSGITSYESQLAEQQRSVQGDWRLLTTANGQVVGEVLFEGFETDIWGEVEPLDTAFVLVPTSPRVDQLELYNAQGALVATRRVGAVCGDGFCATGEQLSCPQDCQEAVDESVLMEEYELELAAESGYTPMQIGLIVAAGLLVIVLILVLVMMNRKKPAPTQQIQ